MSNSSKHGVSRRTLVQGAAWSVPVVAVAAQAPAAAATLRMDPGINGWVGVTQGGSGCSRSLRFDSTLPGTGPDGAPYGLYIYDTEPGDEIDGASMTLWVEQAQSNITWATGNGHSNCWSGPTNVGTMVKPDGLTYEGYRWNYVCPINPENETCNDPDGVCRLYLQDFHVLASRIETRGGPPWYSCRTPNYWVERRIVINGVPLSFQRRNGRDGPWTGQNRASVQSQGDTSEIDAQIADLEARIADLDQQIAAVPAATEPTGDDMATATAAPGEVAAPAVDVTALQTSRDELAAELATLVEQRSAAMAEPSDDSPKFAQA